MVITALNRYYEILKDDENSNIPLNGYAAMKVSACLVISSKGELLDIMTMMIQSENGKKLVTRTMILPEPAIVSVNIAANFTYGAVKYVLGIDSDGKVYPKHFLSFKELHRKIFEKATGVKATALLSFVEQWNEETASSHPVVQTNLETVFENGNLVFRVDGEPGFIHDDGEVKSLWEAHCQSSPDDILGQCMISGKPTAIARIHPKIKGIRGAQSSGASLISFNARSHESYGKTQSYNAPIGKHPTFCYTTALNYMLGNRRQKLQIGDATVVFWAESKDGIYTDTLAQALGLPTNEEELKNQHVKQAQELISDVLYRVKTGQAIENLGDNINSDTKCYILGLSPNSSRISVRFFHTDNFGDFLQKTALHYSDMAMVKEFEKDKENIPIWHMMNELVSPKSSEKTPSPLIAGAVMRSIVSGNLYPESLYNSVLQRVKTDSDIRVNYIRASIIKAYLLRKSRINQTGIKEAVTVALNEQNTDTAYLLGRLFAVLEKTQKDSGNETLKSRYFTSACTTPGTVFPILLRLSQHHIAKMKYGYISEIRIGEIIDRITQFPANLTLEQQGLFMLGYYQQRVKLWEKQSNETGGTENEQ